MDPKAQNDEQPRHTVKLSPFWIARWPVTVAQFQAFVRASDFEVGDRDSLKGIANHPVVWVSWEEARSYCKWLTERLREMAPKRGEASDDPLVKRFWQGLVSGELRMGLPTEAQWEAAARGPDARLYPWGGEQPTDDHAGFGGALGTTAAVGIYPRGRGPFGSENQAGNVWEWCADVWDEGVYAKRAGSSPIDPITTEGDDALRCLRGGAWGSPPRSLRAASRYRFWPGYRGRYIGFRVCGSGPEHG